MTRPDDTNPQPRLPTYRPKGMSKWDKIAMWSLIFIVVLFGLGMVTRLVPDKGALAKSHPTVTVTHTAVPKAIQSKGAKVYVVINTTNGYLWWLDNTGSKFTASSAALFAKGHKTFHVAYLYAG